MPPVENMIGAAFVAGVAILASSHAALTPTGAFAIRSAGGALALCILAAAFFR